MTVYTVWFPDTMSPVEEKYQQDLTDIQQMTQTKDLTKGA